MQQKLQAVQKLLPYDTDNVQVNFSRDSITVTTGLHSILLPVQRQRPEQNLQLIVDEVFNAETIYDWEISMEDNLDQILAYITKKDNPVGQRIVMYFHLGRHT